MPNMYTSPVGQPGAGAGVNPAGESLTWGDLVSRLVGTAPYGQTDASHWGNLVNQDAPAYQSRFPTVDPATGQVINPQALPGEQRNVPLSPRMTGGRQTVDYGLPFEVGMPEAARAALDARPTSGGIPESPVITTYRGEQQTSRPASTQPINYGPTLQREAPTVVGDVFGEESGPVRYVTDGGRSTMVGGYGDNSQLAAWAAARHFGQDNPAQMAQRDALARTMAVRNSNQYQNIYQKALRETGNPMLASAQADALFAEQLPGYAGDFINSGQDAAVQQRFDQGLQRLNSAATINPEVGNAAYRSNLPTYGTYAAGVSPTGESVTVTPDGSTTQMPRVGYSPIDLNKLSPGAATGKTTADPNQLTAYQRQQLLQGEERNAQGRVRGLSSQLNTLYSHLNQLQRNGGDPIQVEQVNGQIAQLQRQLNMLTGVPDTAQPVITNSNTGGK